MNGISPRDADATRRAADESCIGCFLRDFGYGVNRLFRQLAIYREIWTRQKRLPLTTVTRCPAALQAPVLRKSA